jgi:prepilin-type N-terminal cleavage/methylation domain-containing protein
MLYSSLHRLGNNRQKVVGDSGFTIIELIVVIVITSLLAGVFSQVIVSSVQIYTNHNIRKSSHDDLRRSFDMMVHDLREFDQTNQWVVAPSNTQLLFWKYNCFWADRWYYTGPYYARLRVGYTIGGADLTYRRDEADWNATYPLVQSGLVGGVSIFSTTTEGGVTRINMNARILRNDQMLFMRSTVFPRWQGG